MVRIPRLHKESSVFSVGGIAAQLRVLADRIALVVSDASTASSVEVTPGFISAVTSRLRITDPEGTSTVVEGGRIRAASLTLGMLAGAVTGAISDATKTATNYITAIDNNGIKIHAANNVNSNYAGIDATGMEVVRGGTSMAKFGEVTRIGKEYVQGATNNESYMELDYHSLKLVDKEGSAYFYVGDLRDRSGKAVITTTFVGDGDTTVFTLPVSSASFSYTVSVSDGSGGTIDKGINNITFSSAPSDGATITVTYATGDEFIKAYTVGFRSDQSVIGPLSYAEGLRIEATEFASHAEGAFTSASGRYSHAENSNTTASGTGSHAEGYDTTASGESSHAEGRVTTASGKGSHAEGYDTTASGESSHAEGRVTTASGKGSHAEGIGAVASTDAAHAEGWNTNARSSAAHAEGVGTFATGPMSHAEGKDTTASGWYSHAQNFDTIAGYDCQTAIGKYNDNDSANAFEVGNGTADDARSNAFTVGWDGRVTTSRDILVTSTSDMSDIITAGSGITIDIFKFCQRSNVASILLRAKKSTATAANTAITVGTIAADRRPPFECAGPGTSGVGDCWVDETGVVKFRSTSQIAANANFYVRVTYPVV